jgi:hypothetical protein
MEGCGLNPQTKLAFVRRVNFAEIRVCQLGRGYTILSSEQKKTGNWNSLYLPFRLICENSGHKWRSEKLFPAPNLTTNLPVIYGLQKSWQAD